MSGPVTVSIVRHVAPAHAAQMVAWVRAGSSLAERRTGIEGWFDEPASRDVEDLRPAAPAPARWEQAVVIWLAFFPLSLVLALLLRATGLDLGIAIRTLIATLVATPIMTYGLLPWMTKRFEWWLKPSA